MANPCCPSLTEEMILNPDYLPEHMRHMRRYRIEYGFEDESPEGLIYLEPDVNPEDIELILSRSWKKKSNGYLEYEGVGKIECMGG